ncbi:hypothetical protein [Streptomyces sp. NPDC046712]|uniref:hypothetical protein n=1 Tax=Streptomyces sp. NPDC046712 TaxID=3154802 RepID=UPI0033D09FE0
MAERGWNDSSDYDDAVQRAEQATRLAWTAIAGTTGALACVLVVMALVCVVAVMACVYVVVAMDY